MCYLKFLIAIVFGVFVLSIDNNATITQSFFVSIILTRVASVVRFFCFSTRCTLFIAIESTPECIRFQRRGGRGRNCSSHFNIGTFFPLDDFNTWRMAEFARNAAASNKRRPEYTQLRMKMLLGYKRE